MSDDLIRRSKALGTLMLDYNDITYIDKNVTAKRIEAIPSVQPEPVIIRINIRLSEKDFQKAADVIRAQSPDVIVIPCDAEYIYKEGESNE